MTGRGRPLRFLLLMSTCWITIRVAWLWPQTGSLPEAIRRAVPVSAPRHEIAASVHLQPSLAPAHHAAAPVHSAPASPAEPAALPWLRYALAPPQQQPRGANRLALALVGMIPADQAVPLREPLSEATFPRERDDGRWQASAWLYVRGDRPAGALDTTAPQLGGSQTGARATYALDSGAGLSAVGRAAAPLHGTGAETAFGIQWRPDSLPVALVAQQRLGLDGQEGGPELSVIGGNGPTPVAPDLDLETYGQAGAVFRDRTDYYAAGAVRLSHPVAEIENRAVRVGIGSWISTQRGATRIDIGPTAIIRLPVEGAGVRLSLDWRQRMAGDARPGSGPALTLGADF
ncbi:hypothetical protein [Stakelama saccharophila]|uniref:Uncharacterized protein n=1 Tax=Stakelama saccharophila TaxID=3075605 RepID=A0ABZ0BDA4_9SPHN|nr:hypothetical protein [Stakelama sp. W311]WNO54279.1 hypothetical protein RPR59_03175 [Stakelama sp. W311]